MSKIDDLIKEYCPNGVEYKPLNIIGNLFSGLSGKSKSDFEDGNVKYISYMNIYKNPSTNLDCNDYVKVLESEKQNHIKKGDILIAGSSENLEDSGMISVVTKDPQEKIYLNSFCFGFRLKDEYVKVFLPDFLKHLFRDKNFRNQIIGFSFGVTRYNLSKKGFLSIKIPIPPIPVQEEIVKILDRFIKLEVELEAELEARKIQYEFYRGNIFEFNTENVKIKRLGEIASFSQGLQVDLNDQFDEPFENSIPLLRIVDFVKDNEKPRYIKTPAPRYIKNENEMIMIRYGASAAGKVFTNKYGAIANNMFKIIFNDREKTDIDYIKYFLSQKKIYEKLNNSTGKSTMPAVNFNFVSSIEIPVPSIEEQKRIVSILDRFDKLINDISGGLPAEIEARRKQYEYYRNKLLSFEELNYE